jgi:uncharacterized membrane protein YjjP (DUF1212 family)
LEYNESSGAIHRALTTTAQALTGAGCQVAVSYRCVTIALEGEAPALVSVEELRYNTAVQARTREILNLVCRGDLDPSAALALLDTVERDTPGYPRWLVTVVLGTAAASLAGLLGADISAAAVAGLATSLGLLARQELGRRNFNRLALPLTAAFIGAILGGLAVRLGWTRNVELVLVVPALMLVPGPHLINGLLDLIDNYVPMSLARLGLAMGILLASAAGIVLGVELTLPDEVIIVADTSSLDHLNLVSDIVLAGIVACGFAMFYNTAWSHLWMATVGGMAGHGIRFVSLQAGLRLEGATFLGGLVVGIVSAWMARTSKTPFAVIAFAGAVTMIPGLNLYRAFGGALKLARLPEMQDSVMMAATLSNALQAFLVVGALALGLILAARTMLALTQRLDSADHMVVTSSAVATGAEDVSTTTYKPTAMTASRSSTNEPT